jgi:hypothetical protein
MEAKKTFKVYVQYGNEFSPAKNEVLTVTSLEPGAYKFDVNFETQARTFTKFAPKCDNIIDLPSPEYSRVVKEMEAFLTPQVRQNFEKYGFLYKRSAMLEGKPGTGKSVIVNRVMQTVINKGGICLFIEDPRIISMAYEVLEDLNPNNTVLTVLEEIDGMIKAYGDQALLSVLDGEIQKANVMYLATTNYIDKIPARILRPGRFSSIITVNYPNQEARQVYFETKLGKEERLVKTLVMRTEGLSVDELKEVVQSCYIFGYSVDETVERIKNTRSESEKEEAEGYGQLDEMVLKQSLKWLK